MDEGSVAPTPACSWSVWTSARCSGTILRGTARTGLLLPGVYHISSFSSIRYRSFCGYVLFYTELFMICFRKRSLFCWATSSDVSVGTSKLVRWPTQFLLGSWRPSRSSLLPPLLKGHRLLAAQQNNDPFLICFRKGSLFCWETRSDVSVSTFRARSMADAVSPGTLATVEELATPPPAKMTSPISTATEEDAVVGLFVLGSVSFSLGNTVTGVEVIWLVKVRAAVCRQTPAFVVWVSYLLSPAGSPTVCLRVVWVA